MPKFIHCHHKFPGNLVLHQPWKYHMCLWVNLLLWIRLPGQTMNQHNKMNHRTVWAMCCLHTQCKGDLTLHPKIMHTVSVLSKQIFYPQSLYPLSRPLITDTAKTTRHKTFYVKINCFLFAGVHSFKSLTAMETVWLNHIILTGWLYASILNEAKRSMWQTLYQWLLFKL